MTEQLDSFLVSEFKDLLPSASGGKTRTSLGVVSESSNDGTLWVRLVGSDKDTPAVRSSVTVSTGDMVRGTVENGQLVVTDNLSSVGVNINLFAAAFQAFASGDWSGMDSFVSSLDGMHLLKASIDELDSKLVRTERLEADYIDADQIHANYAELKELHADYAHITDGVIDNATIDHADVNDLDANYAHITSGVIDNAKIGYADVENLEANYAHITEGVIDNATIDHADVNDLDANYAHITDGAIDNAVIGYEYVRELENHYAHITLGVIDNATIDHADVNDLDANYAHITEGVIDNATIDHADVNALDANYAHITEGVIDNATIDHADVNDLDANYAHITLGVIDNAKINQADVEELRSHYAAIDLANIANGTIKSAMIDDAAITTAKIADAAITTAKIGDAAVTTAKIGDAQIGTAKIADAAITTAKIGTGQIDTALIKDGAILSAKIGDAQVGTAKIVDAAVTAAKIGDAAVTNAKIGNAEISTAKIQNGAITTALIEDAAITNEKVLGVSANKLTAGTIDASKINVANLRARNLIVDKINGQPVLGGYTLVQANTPGYSGMNPSERGWYEMANGAFVLSTDTAVDADKAYYVEGDSTLLYDQDYIDGIERRLDQRIDGAVETFTGTDMPTLVNYPYTEWYDTTISPVKDNRAEHVGDIYYVVNASSSYDGYCYRFAYDNSTQSYLWVLIKDSDVTKALSDIDDLQEFQSETVSWQEETDEGLRVIRQNHTELSGIVGDTVKSSVQLWFAKANTTAPAKPTAHVTSTSTAGNAWTTVVPAYNASYPNYFYCWEYEYASGSYGWSAVVYDRGVTEARSVANKNVKESVQLWFSKADATAPAKPTSVVSSTDASGNAWRVVVPTYNASYPYYFYCYQHKLADGSYTWTDVVYDRATTETQSTARATSSSLANYIVSNDAAVQSLQDQVDGAVDIWYGLTDPSSSVEPESTWTSTDDKDLHVGDLYYNTTNGHSFRYVKSGNAYSWTQIPDSDAAAALSAAQDAQATADGKRRIFTVQPVPPYDVGDLWVDGSTVKYANEKRESGSFASSEWSLTATDDTLASKNVKDVAQLWFTKADATAPGKPTAEVTSTGTGGNAWTKVVPTWNATYPYYFYCYQQKLADNTFTWTDVVYDRGTSEAQQKAAAALPASTFTTFQTTTFKELVDEVDEQSSTITTLSSRVDSSGFGGIDLFSMDIWERGTTNEAPGQTYDQMKAANISRIRFVDLQPIRPGEYKVSIDDSYFVFFIWFDSDKTMVSALGWTGSASVTVPQNVLYYIAIIRKADNSEITVAEAETTSLRLTYAYADGSTVTTLTNTVNTVKQTADSNKSSITSLTNTTSQLRTDLDGIEIGGRNLLLNSEIIDKTKTTFSSSTAAVTSYVFDGVNAYNVGGSAKIIVSFPTLTAGQEYTLSFDYNRQWSVRVLKVDVGAFSETKTMVVDSTRWYRFEMTFVADADTSTAEVYVNESSSDWTVFFRHFKLEKGNKATDWTPAPEDVESEITTLSTTTTNKFNTIDQTLDGINTSIGNIQTTVSQKADGSTVTNLTSKVNTMSDTVDGHTQSIQSINSTVSSKADKSAAVVSTVQLWFSKADTTAPSKPTAHVTSTATTGNAWTTVVPAYNASYPNYFYCYEWQYADGTYGWSAVTRDIAMGESQERARTGVANAAAAKAVADKNVKSSVQLWFTKADATSPAKPAAKVTTDNAATGNAWNLAVPTYNASYKNYFYCYQYELADGTYAWSDVVYDRATTENQANSRAAQASVSTLQQDYATFKQTVNEFESTVGSTYATKTEMTEGDIYLRGTSYNNSASRIMKVSGVDTANSGRGLCLVVVRRSDLKVLSQTVYDVYASDDARNDLATTLSGLDDSVLVLLASFDAIGINENLSAQIRNCGGTVSALTAARRSYAFVGIPGIGAGNGIEVIHPASTTGLGLLHAEISTKIVDGIPVGVYYGGEVESRLSTAETSITQTNEQVALKANASDVYTKAQSDGLISTEVSNRNAAIEASANSITSTVASTYATKTELSKQIGVRFKLTRDNWTDSQWATYEPAGYSTSWSNVHYYASGSQSSQSATGFDATTLKVGDLILVEGVSTDTKATHSLTAKVTAVPSTASAAIPATTVASTNSTLLSGRLTSAETKITQNENAISLRATKTEVSNAIDDIEIGGRNLFRYPSTGTAWLDEEHELNPYQSKGSFTQFNNSLLFDPSTTIDEEYTISFDVKSPNGSTSVQLYNSNSNPKYFWFTNVVVVQSLGNEWVHVEHTVVNREYSGSGTPSTSDSLIRRIEVYAPNATGVLIRKIKVEKGNKATDWTPAPEIMATSAELKVANDAISTKVEKNGVISSINQSSESITIDANRVDIEGATIFSSGRLSTTSLNNAYDVKGSAEAAQAAATNAASQNTENKLKSYSTTDEMNEAIDASLEMHDFTIDLSGSAYDSATWYPVVIQPAESGGMTRLTMVFDGAGGTPSWSTHSTKHWAASVDVTYKPSHWGWISDSQSYIDMYTFGQLPSGMHPVTFSNVLSHSDYLVMFARGGAVYPVRINTTKTPIVYTETYSYDSAQSVSPTTTQPANTSNFVKSRRETQTDINAAQATADAAAPKTSAIAQTQRIYYQSSSTTKPGTPGADSSNWVTDETGSADRWTRKRMSYSSSKPYIYTCEQKITVSGAVSYTTVLLDDTTTVIDGGKIITGSVAANKLDATSINASGILTVGAMTSATQSSVLNSEIEIGGRNLLLNSEVIDKTKTTFSSSTAYMTSYVFDGVNSYDTSSSAKIIVSFSTLTAGQEYALSFEYNRPWAAKVLKVDVGSFSESKTTVADNTRWYRFETTFVADADTSTAEVYLDDGSSTRWTGFFRHFKLEKGNKATDWTKAPEDVDAVISTAQSTANGANAREQYIYISKASGTSSVTANTTWVTSAADQQNTWTTKRPTYSSSYPVLFVAQQRQTVAQSSGTACTCTTPVKDDTTTVIDGGHITTGTIDASKATITNIDASNITTGSLAADRMSANVVSAVQAKVSDLYALVAKIGGFTVDSTSLRTAALTSNADNSIGLSTADFTRTVNGTSRAGLRFAIGDKLGITGDGVLYANGANITSIDAGNISAGTLSAARIGANSITADKMKIWDSANYSQLNDDSASYWGFTADTTADGHWYSVVPRRDIFLSHHYECSGGEKFRVSYEISSTAQGSATSSGTAGYVGTAVGLYAWNDAGTSVGISYATRHTADADGTVHSVESECTLAASARRFRVFLQTEAFYNWSGTIKIRNLRVYRKAGGELIVDGAVTADKISVTDLQAIGATIGGFDIASTALKTKGVAVTSNADNSIALSSADFTRTVNGTSRAGLRFAIGDKLGITGDGVLYANGANITNIDAGNISAGNISADRMSANVVSAVQAKVSDLYALVAKIGGFTVDSTSLRTAALTSNADNSIGLSTADFTRTVNGTSRAGLRFAIGDKLGITGDGVLYANGANITNIDASNITTGTLSADRIGANSLTIGKVSGLQSSLDAKATPSDISTVVDNLAIGVRNLLPYTQSEIYGTSAAAGGITVAYDKDGWFSVSGTRSGTGVSTVPLWLNAAGDYDSPVNSLVPQSGGEPVSIKVETEGTPFLSGTSYTTSSHIVFYGSLSSISIRRGGHTPLTYSGTPETYISKVNYYIGTSATGSVDGRFRIMLVRGDKPTDWLPALEDGFQKPLYGTSDTAADTRTKAVACPDFKLYTGAEVTVKFTYSNQYISNSVQLNVNSTGTKNVYAAGAITESGNQLQWVDGAEITFRYDGTGYVVVNEPRAWEGSCTTAAATKAKVASIPGFVACKGTKILLYMSETNSVATPTLQIGETVDDVWHGTTARNIRYYDGGAHNIAASGIYNWPPSLLEFTFNGNFWYISTVNASKYITHVNDAGISVHPSSTTADRVAINADGMQVYKDDVSVASYGDTARIGKEAGPRVLIQPSGVDLYGASDGSANLAHFGYASARDSSGGSTTAPYYTLGVRTGTIGGYSVVAGHTCQASGFVAYAEGENTEASDWGHAEGHSSQAVGLGSHAQNFGSIAWSDCQTAIGTFNVKDDASDTTHPGGSGTYGYGTYALIVGNGTSNSARSNAAALRWDGVLELAKPLPVAYGGTEATTAANARTKLGVSPTLLYSNDDGTTGTVTLAYTAANYSRLVIYYYTIDGSTRTYGSCDIYSPNGKRTSFYITRSSDASNVYTSFAVISISAKSITRVSSGNGQYGAATGVNNTNNVYIHRVEGYAY